MYYCSISEEAPSVKKPGSREGGGAQQLYRLLFVEIHTATHISSSLSHLLLAPWPAVPGDVGGADDILRWSAPACFWLYGEKTTKTRCCADALAKGTQMYIIRERETESYDKPPYFLVDSGR